MEVDPKTFYTDKRILVTGGAGFIGSHLVKRLLNLGAVVGVADDLSRGSLANLASVRNDISEQCIYRVDLSDHGAARSVVQDFQPDIVFHLADAVAGVKYTLAHEYEIYTQNMRINDAVFSACQYYKVPNVVYVGTACSYPKHLQTNEEDSALRESDMYPADPESGYGWSKLMGEYQLELLSHSDMHVGTLRLHNVYGPNVAFDEETSQVIPSLIRKVVKYPLEEPIIWGTGEQTRDFVYVNDVIDALVIMPINGMNAGPIQICSGAKTSINTVANIIKTISGKSFDWTHDLNGPVGDQGRYGSYWKAQYSLDWKPRTSLRVGLLKTYTWLNYRIQKGIADD